MRKIIGLSPLRGSGEDMSGEPSLKCGIWTERKEGASSLGESPGACRCIVPLAPERWARGLLGNVKTADAVSGFRRLRALCIGLKSSSLGFFRLLMRVPSGPLRVSWLSPRKEMIQLWLLVSQADSLFRTPQREDIQPEAPCRVAELRLSTSAFGFFWMSPLITVLVGGV